jgi:hypothetical protein
VIFLETTGKPVSDVNVLMVVNTYAPDDPRVIFSASSLVINDYRVLLPGAARQKIMLMYHRNR